MSCAFEAVQVTTQLSSKRYSKCCISALVRVSNLFCKNSRLSYLNLKEKNQPMGHTVPCYCSLVFLFSDSASSGVLFVINDYKWRCWLCLKQSDI